MTVAAGPTSSSTYALRLGRGATPGVRVGRAGLDEAPAGQNHRGKTHGAVRWSTHLPALAVTGTPFENRLMGSLGVAVITTPGALSPGRAFTQHVVRPVEKEKDEAALQRFRQRIRPFLLRRTKELVAPSCRRKQEQVLPVVLAPRHRKTTPTSRGAAAHPGLVGTSSATGWRSSSALTKLRQLALDPALVDLGHDAGFGEDRPPREHVAEITAEGAPGAGVQPVHVVSSRRGRGATGRRGIATTYLDGTTLTARPSSRSSGPAWPRCSSSRSRPVASG